MEKSTDTPCTRVAVGDSNDADGPRSDCADSQRSDEAVDNTKEKNIMTAQYSGCEKSSSMKDVNERGTPALNNEAKATTKASGGSSVAAAVLQDRRSADLNLEAQFLRNVQPLPGNPSAESMMPAVTIPGAFPVMPRFTTRSNTAREELAAPQTAPHQQEVEFMAELVEDHDHGGADTNALCTPGEEVIEARILQEIKDVEQERSTGTTKAFWWLLAICFTAALVLILVLLLGPTQNNTSEIEPIQSNSSESHIAQYPPFRSNLPQEVTAAIQDEGSPFYMANVWVLKDPHLHLYSESRQAQRFYLAMLYYATNGNGWIKQDNWLSYDVSECDWYSHSSLSENSKYYEAAVCDSSSTNATVINLSLASNNLTGSFPIWYSSFIPQLRILDLADNFIGGAFPIMISTPVLEVLVLTNNPLEGAVKMNAGFFHNIKVINADGTLIRGNNGGKLFYVISRDVEMLNMTGMPNDGQIWTELGMMTSLEYFGTGHTNITGTIPTELGLATSLRKIDMSSLPYLNGTIPSELGLLTHLIVYDLSETSITGTIPAQLCNRVHDGLLTMQVNCSAIQCCTDA
jgi:hypothetical protein